MEIRQNYFAEKSLFREKRILFIVEGMDFLLGEKGIEGFVKWRESRHKSKADIEKAKLESKLKKIEAIQAEKKANREAKSYERIAEINAATRLEMAKLGILTNADGTAQTPTAAPQNAIEQAPNSIEGLTTKISILKNIPLKERENHRLLAERINNLLAGKGTKEPDKNLNTKLSKWLGVDKNAKELAKKVKLENSGEEILRRIDPSYVKPASRNYSLETQKVIAKALKENLSKELIEKAMAGDDTAEKLVAKEIGHIYKVLEKARNLESKKIEKAVRGGINKILGPAGKLVLDKESKEHLENLKKPNLKDFEKAEGAFGIEEGLAKKEAAKAAAAEKKKQDGKPTSKLGKIAYYGLVVPVAYDKIIEPTAKFLWEKTFGKGPVIGTARTALWVLGSGVTGGIPAIPVAVEAAIWAAQKIKPGKKAEKVKDEAVHAAKNVANIATLGIPRFAAGILEKAWNFVKLDRKPKPTKPTK